jgi:diguanylate cyclase (GGDEF)-like protein
MPRITPTLKIALALVFVTCALLVFIDSMLQIFPDPEAQTLRVRSAVAQSIAAQTAALAQQRDPRALEDLLAALREQNVDIRSIAVRREDKTLIRQAGEHDPAWAQMTDESSLTRMIVPLSTAGERWGRVEIAFAPEERTFIQRVLRHPRWITLLSVVPLGLLFFWIYMKRALVHLDPTSVIPQRVRLAFDVMTEGVAVLDRQGRVLLANNALLALQADDSLDPVGKPLSTLPWLAPSLPAPAAEHPWNIAMREAQSTTNYAIELHAAGGPSRKVAINCGPILDEKATVRGALATFDDVTELHLANEQLRLALVELKASQEEIERKNVELEHLATHDVLTGCLTRRAFFQRMTQALDAARSSGAPLSCVVLDIDRFKTVNDTRGHAVGDRVVQEVGKQLLASFGRMDLVGRCGGDEFFIGMPGSDLAAAMRTAEAMRKTMERECAARIPNAPDLIVTVSVGVAALSAGDDSLAHLLERADQALYAAKSAGRNRVAAADAVAAV